MSEQRAGKVRLLEPERRQGVIRFEMPEDTLPPSHTARVLWRVVGTLDLSPLTRHAKAFEGAPGRPGLSPHMLLCLWLYAISQGIGSAREIARLVKTDVAFGWIVGDVAVSHHALSAFRVRGIEAAAKQQVELLVPVPAREKGLASASPEVAAWRARMETPEAKKTFRARASLCELANVKDRFDIDHVLVRGTTKVTCVILLAALAFNLLQHAGKLLA